MKEEKRKTDKVLALPQEGFARPAQFAHAMGVSRPTLYNLMKNDPDFPSPKKEGARITLWPVGDIRAYIAKKGGTILPQAHLNTQPIPAS